MLEFVLVAALYQTKSVQLHIYFSLLGKYFNSCLEYSLYTPVLVFLWLSSVAPLSISIHRFFCLFCFFVQLEPSDHPATWADMGGWGSLSKVCTVILWHVCFMFITKQKGIYILIHVRTGNSCIVFAIVEKMQHHNSLS